MLNVIVNDPRMMRRSVYDRSACSVYGAGKSDFHAIDCGFDRFMFLHATEKEFGRILASINVSLEQVKRLSDQFDRAVILIEGHTNSSSKGRVPVQAFRELSLSRAGVVQRALTGKLELDPNKFSIEIERQGWDVPADSDNPDNQMLNRRVEISMFPFEQ